ITGVGAFPYTLAAHLNADGTFFFPETIAGPFTAAVTANVGGLTLYGSTGDLVVHDANTHITISMQNSGTVTGLVLRSDGTTPALGANVVVRLDGDGRTVALQAGTDGRFTIRG